MKFNSIHFPKMMLSVLCAMALVSCSKDNDLLADYVINDDNTLITETKIVDDTFAIGLNQSIVLDVLSNDNFQAGSTVTIVSVTQPNYGTVMINEDNTLTYTPDATAATSGNTNEEDAGSNSEETAENDASTDSEESGDTTTGTNETNGENQGTVEETTEDSFDYTTEETNEAGETTTDEGTVTVTTEESKIPTSGDNVFFVTTSGSGNNDGLSEETAWSWKYAAANAKPGMIIYVKAGVYNINNGTTLDITGAQNQIIQIIGYQNKPGDIESDSRFYNYPALPNNEFPTFRGTSSTLGWGITWKPNSFVHWSNFAITNFDIGSTWNISNGKLNNIAFYNLGEQKFNTSGSGSGLRINGMENLIENCYFLNTGSIALSINSEKNIIRNTQIIGDNVLRPVGYFIICSGNKSKYNVIENIDIQRRTPDNLHQGHGLIAKDGAEYNIFRNSILLNTGIEASYKNTKNNKWENITIKTEGHRYPNTYAAGVRIMNGSNNNLFKNIYIENNASGVEFRDYDDGSSSDLDKDAQEGGSNNDFVNIVVNNVKRGIWFSDGEGGSNSSNSDNNKFSSCTFFKMDSFISSDQNINNLSIENSIIDTVRDFILSNSNGTFNYSFKNCNLSNFQGELPKGEGLTKLTPSFISSSLNNFRLNGDDLKLGNETSTEEATKNFDGKQRSIPFNLGAF